VESHPGIGTTFRIYLPRLLGPLDPQATAPEIQTDLAGRGETILLVEDELSVRTILRIMLERAGYQVIECSSGTAALELWPKHQAEVNLLMTDMVMPGAVGGVKLAQKLLKEKPDLKVIITSGYSANLNKDRKKFDVEIAFIPKPYEQKNVLAVVRARLDAGQTESRQT
jgi:DNA-binding NtrC family response regulator